MSRSPEPIRIGSRERPADAPAREPAGPASPTAYVLWLQGAVGNRATRELIASGGARSPLVQRDPNNGDKEKEGESKGKEKEKEPEKGGRETEVTVTSDTELNALPEKLRTAPPQPSPAAKTKVRVVMYTPFTGHRDKGIEGLSEGPSGKEHLARIDLLTEKVKAALRVLDAHPDGPDTLRLFLAPEWFFTGKEGDKPYTVQQVHEIIAELEAFSEVHPDIVLVPGSIRWARPEPEPAPWPPEKRKTSPFEKLKKLIGGSAPPPPEPKQALFNSAVVIQGGEMKFMYHKQHEGTDFGGAPEGSKQEFVNEVEGTWAFERWQKGDPSVLTPKEGAEPSTADPNALRRTGAPSNFFTIEGIDFAVDICADFGRGTALRSYIDSQKGEGVDVHLVMAAGIGGQLSPSTTVARVGGFTLLAEGGFAKQRPELRSKVGKVKKREGTLEQAAKGHSASAPKVEYEEQERKQFVEESPDLVIFEDVLVLPPRSPAAPPPPGTA
jgi:predicted amidohydrolase